MTDSNNNRYFFPEEEDQTTNLEAPSVSEPSPIAEDYNTSFTSKVNNPNPPRAATPVKEHYKDLLHEMLSAALVSVGEVLQTKYTEERTDGKPRQT